MLKIHSTEDLNALAADILARRQGLNPVAVLKWSENFNFDLIRHGYLLANNGDEFFNCVLNNKSFPIKISEVKN